jgi:eukaryotic-like serine/threonine-protein kinase
MAEVWEAHDDVLTRDVAVKVLHAQLARDETFRVRFRREAVAAARLAHPNVVATFDTGTDGDTAFIVMELVRGHSLRQLIAQEGQLDPAVAVRIAVQMARALEHAHRAGLVHRDVKPANVLMCDDAFGNTQVKVTDFGIAKAAAEDADADVELTEPGAIVGTAKYLSPEQAQGLTPDQRSDVYALGVVLYEMLSGRAPFEAATELGTAMAHVHGEPPRLRRLRSRIPRQLEAVVMQALAKDPTQRFQSAADFRIALERIDFGVDDAEPMVRRDRTPPRGTPGAQPRPASRSPVTMIVVGLVLAAAVALIALVLGQASGDDDATPGAGSDDVVRIAGVTSYDPQGDGSENEREASLAADGNGNTAWQTERYRSRPFGRFRNKTGVGLVLRLDSEAALERLQVSSATNGWAARVYVANGPQRSLDAWGEAVDTRTNINSPTTAFDLKGRRGSAVLLWITDTGTTNRAQVAELSVSSR